MANIRRKCRTEHVKTNNTILQTRQESFEAVAAIKPSVHARFPIPLVLQCLSTAATFAIRSGFTFRRGHRRRRTNVLFDALSQPHTAIRSSRGTCWTDRRRLFHHSSIRENRRRFQICSIECRFRSCVLRTSRLHLRCRLKSWARRRCWRVWC